MNMNGYGEDNSSRCYFHPKEVVVGVCALCLNEKLLILASKQGLHHSSASRDRDRDSHHTSKVAPGKKPPNHLPKIFALGSLLNRFEFRHWKSDVSDDHDACSSSQEDSFISIKFEDNGVASWEKAAGGTVSKVSLENCNDMSWKPSLTKEAATANNKEPKENKSVIEHAKPRASLRWRKRVGHLFQLVRWKRSNKANVCHVDGHGVKVWKGWIRTLTKRGPKNKGIV